MPKRYGVYQRLVELIEEVGEPANAVQTDQGFKSLARQKSDLVNSICDVLYEIFSIAAIYEVDLDT
ncbi:MAG: hypothetical protein A2Z24_03065 [Candidatus Woykebacteria bacterium RBG_16_44_10]|uniref:NTP pyrophosphohydrolase MazG putative catalytic core domain-containing protein n=1 Tax=Candidatus Woykebacteria bacterium RBG_16_44_10 TaxID=1802597 RepID=A0A1G1WG07_9BACT|nr:MAG: hypothetical protein A2Z24_03065 [Candidatus Woykebacteria bacterium RBG_16_44_10]